MDLDELSRAQCVRDELTVIYAVRKGLKQAVHSVQRTSNTLELYRAEPRSRGILLIEDVVPRRREGSILPFDLLRCSCPVVFPLPTSFVVVCIYTAFLVSAETVLQKWRLWRRVMSKMTYRYILF
jgi:hypothetical protein